MSAPAGPERLSLDGDGYCWVLSHILASRRRSVRALALQPRLRSHGKRYLSKLAILAYLDIAPSLFSRRPWRIRSNSLLSCLLPSWGGAASNISRETLFYRDEAKCIILRSPISVCRSR
jgi:hypothetical protein